MESIKGMRYIAGIIVAAAVLLSAVYGFCAQNGSVSVVNPGFEDGAKGWYLPSNYSVVDDTAHSGKASLRIINTDVGVYQLSAQHVKFQPNTKYHFSAWIKTKGVAGNEGGGSICIEYYDAKGVWLGGAYPWGIAGDADWTLVESDVEPMPANTASIILSVYLRPRMTGTAWFDDIKIEPYYGIPMDAALIKPVYRGRLDAGARDQQVLLYAKVAEKFTGGFGVSSVKLNLRVLSGDKSVLQKIIRPKAGVNEIAFDASHLPIGNYSVVLDLLDPSGKSLNTRNLSFEKIPANSPKPTVYIDEYGRTIRNGKPFFPFGFYFGPGPNRDGSYKEHIDRISNSPFNTVMPYGINEDSLGTIREYLDYLDSKNVCILYSLKDILKGLAWYGENMLGLGDEKRQITGLVTAFKDHPAVLGWYLCDEIPAKYQDRLIERYKLVKSLDANHPGWSVLTDPGALFAYLETCDVMGTDPYPINRAPVTNASAWTAAAYNVAGGHRSVWMVPQVMDWNCYGYDKILRGPTLDEITIMSYLCLIEGAKGMIYYSYFDLQRDVFGFDKRWKDVMTMGNEIKQLIPAVMSIKKPLNLTVQTSIPDIRHRVFADDNGSNYLLLANTHKTRGGVVTVSIPKDYKVQILKHAEITDATSNINNSKLIVPMGPLQSTTVILKKQK